MKNTTYSLGGFILVALGACMPVFATGTALPFLDSFDSYNNGLITDNPSATMWSLSADGVADVQQSDVLTGAGTKACSLTNGTLTLTVQANATYSNVWCRLYLKATGYDDRGGPPTVSNGTSVACYITTNGILKAYASYGTSNGWTNVTSAGGVPTGSWFGVAFHIDYIADKYDIYADAAGTFGATLTKKNDIPISFNTNKSAEARITDLQVQNQAVLDGIALAGSTRGVAASSPDYVRLQNNTASENVAKGIIGRYDAPENKLTAALGADLKTGLQDGDKVRFFYTNGWNVYTLSAGEWIKSGIDPGMPVADFVVPAGLGMWVLRTAATNTSTFYAYDALPAQVTKTLYGSDHSSMAGWNLLAWPFTVSRAANASENWGFQSPAGWGDRVFLFRSGYFDSLWWDDANEKWKRPNNTDSADVLAAGTSFWFYRAASGTANWVVNNPE